MVTPHLAIRIQILRISIGRNGPWNPASGLDDIATSGHRLGAAKQHKSFLAPRNRFSISINEILRALTTIRCEPLTRTKCTQFVGERFGGIPHGLAETFNDDNRVEFGQRCACDAGICECSLSCLLHELQGRRSLVEDRIFFGHLTNPDQDGSLWVNHAPA